MSADALLAFMRSKEPTAELAPILADLHARGLGGFVEVDYAIVRGLAYYTGVVFEVFDRAKNERALAGGGRYDRLLSLMSDGKVDLPALGFGMGDVVLLNLLDEIPAAKAKLDAWCSAQHACDLYVVIAKEGGAGAQHLSQRNVRRLRNRGEHPGNRSRIFILLRQLRVPDARSRPDLRIVDCCVR